MVGGAGGLSLFVVELSQARIATRVSEGVHNVNVPAEKVISRIPLLLDQQRASISLLDVLRVMDNASALNPFQTVHIIRDGRVDVQ